jgi:hypothetical protein
VRKSFSASRRGLLRGSMFGAAAALLSSVLPASRAPAAEAPLVTEDDPTAKGLKYVHDASKSERPDASQFCHNCRYFKGAADAEQAPCEIFGGKAVKCKGWCNVWAKK